MSKRLGGIKGCKYKTVDSHIQRIVLATEEITVTQQVSHRPIKCQSRLWSQRGTKVNGSHHGDNPLLRPTGIQIATKSYAILQAMTPTNVKTVHQTSLLHIEMSTRAHNGPSWNPAREIYHVPLNLLCYEPLKRFIGIMEPRQDNGRRQRHVSP